MRNPEESSSEQEAKIVTEQTEVVTEQTPDYLDMYQIPGQAEITSRGLDRFNTDMQREKPKIEKAAADAENDFFAYKRKIDSADGSSQVELVQEGIKSKNGNEQLAAVKGIMQTEPGNWAPLITSGLGSDNLAVKEACAKLVQEIPEDERSPASVKLLGEIEKNLKGGDINSQVVYAKMIESAPDDQKAKLIEKAIEAGNAYAWTEALEVMQSIPDDKKIILTEKAFSSDSNANILHSGVGILHHIPEAQQKPLAEKLNALIEEGIKSDDVKRQKACATLINELPQEKQQEMRDRIASSLMKVFGGNDTELQSYCADMISLASEDVQPRLFEMAKAKLGNKLVEPPLYKDGEIDGQNFSRTEMTKTGSRTFIYGGELKSKTISRRMNPSSFLSWQEAYGDHKFWKDKGFDYVPIEPIQSFKFMEKDGMVEVYSGVLDLSLASWENRAGTNLDELREEMDRIKQAVKQDKKIIHGHPHKNNFCLKFFRDRDGNVDFNQKPRIYLIDFDQSSSSQ